MDNLKLLKFERIAINHTYSSDWVGGRLFIDDGTNRGLWVDVTNMTHIEFMQFLGY